MRFQSYSTLWNVRKVIYSVNDFKLPFPVSVAQIGWFTAFFLAVLVFRHLPPLVWIENPLFLYFVFPGLLAYVFSSKSFDGKRPLSFFGGLLSFCFRGKETWQGRVLKKGRKDLENRKITMVSVYD
ncbi:MAG: conjugal transfer protein [Peptoniphilaceae bacterium]|nr:conjugal transfer protein [Peptoniphilaceae bacterium]